MKIVYFATPDIALETLKRLTEEQDFEICALVTQPPRPSKRGKKITDSKIKSFANSLQIKVLEPNKISKEKEIIEELKRIQPDFFLTFAFGQILSQEILDIPKFGTVNLHASLLPKYRGANPICEALLNGDKKTGITTMLTVFELDAGDICLTEEILLDDEINFLQLSEIISKKSPRLIAETLRGLYNGKIKPVPQNHVEATFTKKLTKQDKQINWNDSAVNIHNKIRAMLGVNTNHFEFCGKIVKIIKTSVVTTNKSAPCADVINVDKQGILIKCAQDALLIEKVKPEGKKEMDAYSWSPGSKIKKGDSI